MHVCSGINLKGKASDPVGKMGGSRGRHCYVPCTSTCDGDFTDILIPYATLERKGGVTTRVCLYTRPFTTRNQRIKTLEKLSQAIKQAPQMEVQGI